MVSIVHTLNALICDTCGSMQELRGRNAEQHVIALDAFTRRHKCARSQPVNPAPSDRWSELFANIKI